MATPNTLAKFIKSQREAVEKSAAPRFEEIKDNAVEIKRETPTFDNATVAEMRRDLGSDVTTPSGDVTPSIPGSVTLNPKETAHNAANPNTNIENEKQANVNAILNQVRASMGMASPTPKQAAAPVTPAAPAPQALQPSDLTGDVLSKVASICLETEEGCRVVESLLEKSAARRDAAAYMRAALEEKAFVDNVEMHKAAAVSTTLNRAAQIEQLLRANGITEQDAMICIKQAAMHEHNLAQFDHPMLKAAYAEGADDQAAMEQDLEQGGEGNIPMGGEHLSEEEIVQILKAMIEKGDISLEEVQAAIQELGGEGGAPGAQDAPPAADVPPAAPVA